MDIGTVIATAQEAVKPSVITTDREPNDVYFLHNPGANTLEKMIADRPRNHVANSLSAVLEMVNEHLESSRVFASREAVVAFLDDETRRDRVTFTPKLTEQFQFILEQNGKGRDARKFTQADFVFFLRTVFGPVASRVLEAVKKVTMRQLKGGVSEVGHGRSSLAKEDIATLHEHSVPDGVEWEVPIFRAPAPRIIKPIIMALEIYLDGDVPRFQLIPVSGQVEAAIEAAEATLLSDLADGIDGDGKRIHHGKP